MQQLVNPGAPVRLDVEAYRVLVSIHREVFRAYECRCASDNL